MSKVFGLLFLSIVLSESTLYCQMKEGNYPFKMLDTALYKTSKLFVDVNSNPNEFVFSHESMYLKHIMRKIMEDYSKIQIEDSLTFKIHLEKKNPEIVSSIHKINTIHTEIDSRAYVAGIVNNGWDTMSFPIQDGSLIGILEAKNSKNIWKPIQFWPISRCGNSYYSEYLYPGETLIFPVAKNFGNDTNTSLRMKLHGNDTIYVSNEFEGTVDFINFEKPKDAHLKFKYILCDSVFYLEEPYYGDLNNSNEIEIVEFKEE